MGPSTDIWAWLLIIREVWSYTLKSNTWPGKVRIQSDWQKPRKYIWISTLYTLLIKSFKSQTARKAKWEKLENNCIHIKLGVPHPLLPGSMGYPILKEFIHIKLGVPHPLLPGSMGYPILKEFIFFLRFFHFDFPVDWILIHLENPYQTTCVGKAV